MSVPNFSRVEIRHDDAKDIKNAVTELMALAIHLDLLLNGIKDNDLMRLAVHSAIRETSKKLRGI